jgi:hypothetical protein
MGWGMVPLCASWSCPGFVDTLLSTDPGELKLSVAQGMISRPIKD